MDIRSMFAVGVVLLGSAVAQQPAAKSQPAPAAQKPAPQLPEAPAAKGPASAALPTQKDKESYAIGMNWGSQLRKQSVDVNPDILVQGMKDALSGGKTLLTEDEARAALAELQTGLRAKQEQRMKELGEANKKEGEVFLAANKAKEGVLTLPSGLQYKILQPGTGAKPTATDTVVCNYRGTLINGTEFDSSYKRGQPATFPVGRVIKGWTEALQLMPTGSKWQLVIPSDLAYGERGAGADIGPNATLIFEVELLSIQEKPKAPAPAPASAPTPAPNPASPAAAPKPAPTPQKN
jgi:FKBP-type peptidyl-prolyl cis-trans isomerase